MLAEYIIKNFDKLSKHLLSLNCNPGLTEFLIKHNLISNYNTNPKLTPYIKKPSNCNSNPEFTDLITNNSTDDFSGIFSNTNPLLAGAIINAVFKSKLAMMSRNSNPGLTKYLIKHQKDLCYDMLALNENPKLAFLIMRNPYWNRIGSNPNEELTEFIKEHKDKMNINGNPNPKLAETIMNGDIKFGDISNNHNPGLTKFIIENKLSLDRERICSNTNPELAELILEIGTSDWRKQCNNNPGLTEYIMNCRDKTVHYKSNNNPELTEMIMETKIYRKDTEIIANSNPRILPLLYKNREILNFGEIGDNPIIATIDKDRNKKIIDELIT
jgi:hypothetical protein